MIDLKKLSQTRREEVIQMEQGIRGAAAGVLWTTTLRSSTRGGKCHIEAISDNKPTA